MFMGPERDEQGQVYVYRLNMVWRGVSKREWEKVGVEDTERETEGDRGHVGRE